MPFGQAGAFTAGGGLPSFPGSSTVGDIVSGGVDIIGDLLRKVFVDPPQQRAPSLPPQTGGFFPAPPPQFPVPGSPLEGILGLVGGAGGQAGCNTNPFAASQPSQARATAFVTPNPVTNRPQWFTPIPTDRKGMPNVLSHRISCANALARDLGKAKKGLRKVASAVGRPR